ncbi:MAG: phosphoglycerate kinase [Patescibacteria group bacterium]|nr:phosphoglycerate kinase [Patescibacteria group bacterium]
MPLTVEQMTVWCRRILGADATGAKPTMEQFLAAIPRLDCLQNLPSGTPVLIRGDVDAKPGATVGEGDIRLRSMKDTVDYCRAKGWKTIIFGHIGREPEKSLDKVAKRLGEILGCDVPLLDNWLDPASTTICPSVQEAIAKAAPGAVIMLQNTRKYDAERVLWKAKADDLPKLVPNLAKLANEFAEKVAKVFIHEAFSAGSLDSSSVVVPAAMEKVALGRYIAEQFDGPLRDCLGAQLVVFSGLKADKLDDLQAMIDRGKIQQVITGGSLAVALKKAAEELDGREFNLGESENPENKGKPFYIPADRLEQAKKMVAEGRAKGIEFVMPVDFVLQDGQVSDKIGPGNQQFDVGPASSAHYAEAVGQFIEKHKADVAQTVVFHNGVFGMFEDSRFEEGTRSFMGQLKRMREAGIKVYVGGGEGGKAIEKYGSPEDVTYVFTAGGTVLNALGSEPVPYLVALAAASERMHKPHCSCGCSSCS